jgi:hypothetical protein
VTDRRVHDPFAPTRPRPGLSRRGDRPAPSAQFDPLGHTVDQVVAHLATVTAPEEAQRILDIESGRTDRDPRVTVTGAATARLAGLEH